MTTESNDKVSSRLKKELFTGRARTIAIRANNPDFYILRQISYDLEITIPALCRKALEEFLTAHYYPEGFKFTSASNN